MVIQLCNFIRLATVTFWKKYKAHEEPSIYIPKKAKMTLLGKTIYGSLSTPFKTGSPR